MSAKMTDDKEKINNDKPKDKNGQMTFQEFKKNRNKMNRKTTAKTYRTRQIMKVCLIRKLIINLKKRI